MERNTVRVEARAHLNELGQDAGWGLSVSDESGRPLDEIVVHRRDAARIGDEGAIRAALAARYDVSDATIERGVERDDDGRDHPVVRVDGVRCLSR